MNIGYCNLRVLLIVCGNVVLSSVSEARRIYDALWIRNFVRGIYERSRETESECLIFPKQCVQVCKKNRVLRLFRKKSLFFILVYDKFCGIMSFFLNNLNEREAKIHPKRLRRIIFLHFVHTFYRI